MKDMWWLIYAIRFSDRRITNIQTFPIKKNEEIRTVLMLFICPMIIQSYICNYSLWFLCYSTLLKENELEKYHELFKDEMIKAEEYIKAAEQEQQSRHN